MAHYYKNGHRLHPLKANGDRYSEAWSGYNKKCEAEGAVKGVTDILKSGLPTPFMLLNWFAAQAREAAVDVCLYDINYPRETLLELAKGTYDKRRGEPADLGKEIHDAIQACIEGRGLPEEGTPHRTAALAAQKWLEEKGIEEVEAEYVFCTDEYGGTVDVLSRTSKIIVDWKSTKAPRKPYEAECAQTAAYRRGTIPDAQCYNVYFSSVTGELMGDHEWSVPQLELGWELFSLAQQVIAAKGLFNESMKVVK